MHSVDDIVLQRPALQIKFIIKPNIVSFPYNIIFFLFPMHTSFIIKVTG